MSETLEEWPKWTEAMNDNETFLFLLAARLEFEALCSKIVHDGRDSAIVAHALTEKLTASVAETRRLWQLAHTGDQQ